MISRSVGFDKKPDIHARPASRLAGLASGFESMIYFSAGDFIVDAKNAMDILDFFSGNKYNSGDFDLIAMGSDEAAAMDQMMELLYTFR